MEILFKNMNILTRKVTLQVDGKNVTRKIPSDYEGDIDSYIKALAVGLRNEAVNNIAIEKPIEPTSFNVNDIILTY